MFLGLWACSRRPQVGVEPWAAAARTEPSYIQPTELTSAPHLTYLTFGVQFEKVHDALLINDLALLLGDWFIRNLGHLSVV